MPRKATRFTVYSCLLPEEHQWLQRAAAHFGLPQSKLIRLGVLLLRDIVGEQLPESDLMRKCNEILAGSHAKIIDIDKRAGRA